MGLEISRRAEVPAKITIEARKAFLVRWVCVKFMHPPFRRVDGQIVYADPFYKPHPESANFGQSAPHHRVIYGPGLDVGYFGGGSHGLDRS